ncbi:hypothetical protein KHA80_05225 [Anaerobacillus sp. HL2]|nr:hypothetical protein KHA80_05225 [Anaerobacillus sp. HL2]
MLRQLGTFVTTIILPETPLLVVDSLFLLVVLLGTHFRIENHFKISRDFVSDYIIIINFIFNFFKWPT